MDGLGWGHLRGDWGGGRRSRMCNNQRVGQEGNNICSVETKEELSLLECCRTEIVN